MQPTDTPLVSIIMATFNRATVIHDAIESVLEQTLTNWELIIADDGSTDRTAEVVGAWVARDPRIRYLQLPHAGRIAIVSNSALREARGEYVAILDDDDAWIDPRKLEKQVAYLEQHPECVACAGGYRLVNEKLEKISDMYKPESDDEIRKVALRANPIVNSTAMFRRSVGEEYDPGLSGYADWDFWLKMGHRGGLYNFKELFVAYRIWNKNGSFVNQRSNAVSALKVVARHGRDYPGYSQAIWMVRGFFLYTFLPRFIRTSLNSHLTQLKKRAFAGVN
jgi:glycosyltransferase involved in cell wall biosynthesis